MISREVIVKNGAGLDSKQAAFLIQKVSNFKSSIYVEKDERKANAKSLLGLLSLSIASGMKIVIRAEGEDEELAVQEVEEYFNSGLGEAI
ncbi:MAG: HPr family phosphocarrier protein [Clostridia bacterium]|nr:HPr family phosphocarrier protein [Clostridia bacterium]